MSVPINKSSTPLPLEEQGKKAKEIEKERERGGRKRRHVGSKVSG